MAEFLALATIILWPVVPLFWIPVHCAPAFFRRIGRLTYLLPLFTWLPAAVFLYQERVLLLQVKIDLPLPVVIAGGVLLAAGTSLHLWTGRLLGLWGLMGLPEIEPLEGGKPVTDGPYKIVRHPTYLAHTLMFSGVSLLTGVAAVGVITLIDLVVINLFVIPLEDRELISRFGDSYRLYREKVPAFFPRILRRQA